MCLIIFIKSVCIRVPIKPYQHKFGIRRVHSEMSIYNSTNKKLYFIFYYTAKRTS